MSGRIIFVIISAVSLFSASGALAEDRLVPSGYSTIQAAIDDCNDGDVVIIEPNVYTGTGNHDIDFLGKAITVRSTDPNDPCVVAATIIDCQGTTSERHRGFIFVTGEENNSVLDGITITNGCAPVEPLWEEMVSVGGAIYCNTSSPTIKNCIIKNNKAYDSSVYDLPLSYGGGICNYNSSPAITGCTISNNSARFSGGIYNYQSDPNINNCTIRDNTAWYGAGIYNTYSGPVIKNCVITYNTARNTSYYSYGGGIYNNESNPTISDCNISNNTGSVYGGGIYNKGSNAVINNCIINGNLSCEGGGISSDGTSTPVISNCTINNNTATCYGGGIYNSYYCAAVITNCTISNNSAVYTKGGGIADFRYCNPTIKNCVITGNSAVQEGGGYYSYDSNPNIINCTISNNSAGSGGGFYCAYSSDSTITNSIVWGNSPTQVEGVGNTTIEYSDVQGGFTGIGNIDNDPCFMDADANDFHLIGYGSPCYNVGAPNFVPALDETDIDGEPRMIDGRVDMGADELGDCMAETNPGYANWVYWNKPDCWCYRRQCRGDADGEKLGPFWVNGDDLQRLRSAIIQPESQIWPFPSRICADFDHQKLGPFWVSSNDLAILRQYISQLEAQVPVCGDPPDDKFNFWTNP